MRERVEWFRGLASSMGRRCAARSRRGSHPPTGTRATDEPLVSGDVAVRQLRLSDGADWTASRAANERRMERWWDEYPTSGPETGVSAAFYDHFLTWKLMRRRGTGQAWAIVVEDHLVGEILCYYKYGGRSVEIGLWSRPHTVSSRGLFALLVRLTDRQFRELGTIRIEAPVEVGNAYPLAHQATLTEDVAGCRTLLGHVRQAHSTMRLHPIDQLQVLPMNYGSCSRATAKSASGVSASEGDTPGV